MRYFDGKFDSINTNRTRVKDLLPVFKASRGPVIFPTPRNTTSKKGKKMADKFKLVIKDGDTEYSYDKKGNYNSKTIDLVTEYDTFAEALQEFLYVVTDEYAENKASLVFVRGGKK